MRIRWLAPLLMILILAACTSRSPESETGDSAPHGGSGGTLVLPFIADDYENALAQAKERDLPIFVETWAPW